jgi:transposase-like protein
MATFYQFPQKNWAHIRRANVMESPFAAMRIRTDAAKRYKRRDRPTAVIWKMLMVAERRFRHLNAPHLLAKVYTGVGKRTESKLPRRSPSDADLHAP